MADNFSIKRVSSPSDICNAELLEIYESIAVPTSEEVVAYARDGQEVGFLSIEYFDYHQIAIVQKIFVLSACRRRGIGSALLSTAEHLALERGFSIVWLRPRALEKEVDISWLADWYAREGYEWINGDDRMEKRA